MQTILHEISFSTQYLMPILRMTKLQAQPRFKGEPQVGCNDSGGWKDDAEIEDKRSDSRLSILHVRRGHQVLYQAMSCRRTFS